MKRILTFSLLLVLSCSVFSQAKQSEKPELSSVKSKLENLFMEDQLFRKLYPDAQKKFGSDSPQMDYFWKVVEEQDKRIEAELIKIVEEYGWLGIDEVGRLANTAQFSIIQHSSPKTKKKFAPLFKQSVLKKQSQPMHYARLIDRMLVNENRPQIYGSQITKNEEGETIFFEIENPEYVNKRRENIGLGDIEDFAKTRGINWTVRQK